MWRNGVRKSKLLDDSVYEKEVDRLSGLPKYPVLPAAQKELRRALRRISEFDREFLHRLISEVVDSHAVCPTPADLIQLAGAKRHEANKPIGNPDCLKCHGSGFVSFTRKVQIPGMQPYDGEFAAICSCRGGKAIKILEKGNNE